MEKYIITRPWTEGQKVGDVFETKELHPSLVTHVTQVGAAQALPPEVEELAALLKEAEEALKAKDELLASETARADKAEEALKAIQTKKDK